MDDQEKKIKPKYIDDGHTIYNMDVDGMPNKRPKNNEDNHCRKAIRGT